jgi:phosphomannomutase
VTEYRLTYGRFANPIVMKTEVTSDLIRRVAERHGAQVVGDLMVGFKYIGDGIRQLEETGRFRDARGTAADFAVGVEESHGVLVTPAIRDKDAAGAALALAEYAALLKGKGRTLTDALRELWTREGYVHTELVSTVMRGAAGKGRIDRIQAALRSEPPRTIGGLAVTAVLDRADPNGPLGPIKSGTDAASRDVLVFQLGDVARILLRPSGTEPKNKIYVEYVGVPGAPLDTEIPRVEAAAKELTLAFAGDMLGRVGIVLPAWALRVSDLVAIEQKTHFADVLIPHLAGWEGDPQDPSLQAWIDNELKAYGKDPRALVADAARAWAAAHGNTRVLQALLG